MTLTMDNFLKRWNEVSNFDFLKLLEDNQRLSMPTICMIGNKFMIYAFVFSNLPNGNILISQRHFWSTNEHNVILCEERYKCSDNLVIENENYLNKLCKIIHILFQNDLTQENRHNCIEYFSLFNEDMKKVYFSENESLRKWIINNGLLDL